MARSILLLVGAALISAAWCDPVLSQAIEQSISVPGDKQQSFAAGYRTSQLVGCDVYNEDNIEIGRIDDLIVTRDGNVPYAVLSVGGFLGLDSKYVIVPFTSIDIEDTRMIFRGATKAVLEKLPAFHYRT
jgi:sporulation protein YlmC with PRC-barrel domain